jgi:hypothetical protein
MARVRVNINQAAINRLVTNPASPVVRQMNTIGAAVAAVAQINAPVDTGRLRQSVQHELIPRPPELTARISVPVNYAAAVHNGREEVRPRRKKALRFRVGGKVVYATRARAVAGRPFLTDAVKQVTGKTVRRAA